MNNIIKRKWNQNSMVIIEDLQGMAFQAESGGHTFQISGVDGEGNAVALSGTPAGVLLRADGQDVTLTCSVSGGVVSATLPANAYVVPGRFGLTIFLTSDGQKTAIYAAVGTVGKTSSGTVAPPAGSDVVTLVNQINAAIAAIPVSYNSSFAPAYSTSGLYSVSQYVTYNGNLYRCTTAITTAESWTAAHWTQTNLGADVYDLKSAISKRVSNEELYEGVKYKDPEWNHGWISSSGVYDSTDSRYLSKVYPTSAADYILNNSDKTVYVLYFSSYTSLSNFTFDTFTGVTAGVPYNLNKSKAYFAIESTATSLMDTEGANIIVDGSELAYLSHENYTDIANKVARTVGMSTDQEIYDGFKEVDIGWEHGWINSSGIYNSADSRYLGKVMSTSDADIILNGSSTEVYVLYFSSYTDLSHFTFDTFTGTTRNVPYIIDKNRTYFAIESAATASSGLEGVSIKKSFILSYLSRGNINKDIGRLQINNDVARFTDNARHITKTGGINPPPVLSILHFSDLHKDTAALARIVSDAKRFGNLIDDVICTGDMVANVYEQIESWWDKNILTCIGNHDTASYSESYDWTALSVANRSAYYIEPFESNWVLPSGGHPSGKSYYYKDYTTQKVRLIVMDVMLYTNAGEDATAQNTWLTNLLSDAITNNLHVLIAIHSPYGSATAIDCSFSRYGHNDNPLATGFNTPQTVIDIVSEKITAGLKFVGYIVGHTHQDNMWKATQDGKQLMYCVTCANVSQTAQWENYSDQHRSTEEDAYNIVSIDTTNTIVKIVRGGGANVDNVMRQRNAISFNYSTGEIIGEIT